MKIAIEAQRIFRMNKHGMDFVALESIRELQKLDKENEYYIIVSSGEDRSVLKETLNFHIIEKRCKIYPLWEQVALPLAIRRIKPDILHCTSNTAPIFCNIPLLLTLHDIIFLEKRHSPNKSFYQNLGWHYRRFVVPRILKKCRKVITVSNFEAGRIREFLNLPPDKIATVYNGFGKHFKKIDDYYDVTSKYLEEKRYLFFLGNTDPKKNTERVLKAYSLYLKRSSNPLPLLIGDLKESIIDGIIEREGIMDIKKFIYTPGYIPNSELPYIYSGAFAFLYPSLRESFGIPILEAMACGTPVITSNISAMPEIAGCSALLIDPFNENEISEAILKIESEDNLREEIISSGLERVKNFSWENTAKGLFKIYNHVGEAKVEN